MFKIGSGFCKEWNGIGRVEESESHENVNEAVTAVWENSLHLHIYILRVNTFAPLT